jgi:hypothetical protein
VEDHEFGDGRCVAGVRGRDVTDGDATFARRLHVDALQADAELLDELRPGRVHEPGTDHAADRDQHVNRPVGDGPVVQDHDLGLGQRPRHEVTDVGKLGAAHSDEHPARLPTGAARHASSA